jgi:hypothetical protein
MPRKVKTIQIKVEEKQMTGLLDLKPDDFNMSEFIRHIIDFYLGKKKVIKK